ncbi:MAG: Tyrosine recombinase XerD [Anaerolineae bacterium]|nr:Tyrosine recombinase XerD [Anaerolineae bacterium]
MWQDNFLHHLSEQGKSRLTIKQYRLALTHFARWLEQSYAEAFDPVAVLPRDVADWKTYQQTVERTAPATVNQRLTALSRFFQCTNPTTTVKQLRIEQAAPKALNKKQTRRLLRQVEREGNLRDIALVTLLLETGLRISEALALTTADLPLSERSGTVTVRCGKGGQPRTVPLTAEARRVLQDYLQSVPIVELTAEGLWTGQRGVLRDAAGVYKLLKAYAFRAGLDPILVTPHVLRHTFATRYRERNPGDLRGLAALLGHRSLDTVMIYTQPTAEELARRLETA